MKERERRASTSGSPTWRLFLIADDFQIGQPVLSDEEWVERILNPEIKCLEELQKTQDLEYVPRMKGRAKWNN